jgi:hypothetical protein
LDSTIADLNHITTPTDQVVLIGLLCCRRVPAY